MMAELECTRNTGEKKTGVVDRYTMMRPNNIVPPPFLALLADIPGVLHCGCARAGRPSFSLSLSLSLSLE
jgi:hypothetical protein